MPGEASPKSDEDQSDGCGGSLEPSVVRQRRSVVGGSAAVDDVGSPAPQTSDAYIRHSALPVGRGRWYWLTYFGNWAAIYSVATNLYGAAASTIYVAETAS